MAIVGFSIQNPYSLMMNAAGDLSAISTIGSLFSLSIPKIFSIIGCASGLGRMILGCAARYQIASDDTDRLKKANLFIIRGFFEFIGFGIILLILDIAITIFPQCREWNRHLNGYGA